MKHHFEQFASYNLWANARLYQAAFGLSDADYGRDVGAFFKSMHGTLTLNDVSVHFLHRWEVVVAGKQ
jgi:uncharacterized damage-inducible protein DinB